MLYRAQNPHGGDVYTLPVRLDYSANINPLGTPPGVKQAVAESISQLTHYPDPQCRELVSAIAAFEGVEKETILCGSGAAELIFSFCAALSPKHGLLLAPSFCEYENALRASGGEPSYFYLDPANDFTLTEAFLPVLREFQGDALFLCTPNNPTGQVIEPALLQKILAICEEKGIWCLLDECFLDLTEGGEGLSQKGLLPAHPHLMILKAFTKSFGMAALRLGYALSANGVLLEKMAEKTQLWNISIPAQLAGVAALRETEFLEEAKKMIFAQRRILAQGLEKMGLRVIPGRANYLLFYAEQELKAPLLARGILIRSCDNYPGLASGWYRIAVKRPEENRILLETLEEILHG